MLQMLFILLTSVPILLTAFINLSYFKKLLKTNNQYGLYLGLVNLYILIYASFTIVVHLMPAKWQYLNKLAPFMLMDGPILLFGLLLVQGAVLNLRFVLLHCVLPIICWLLFILIISIGMNPHMEEQYANISDVLNIISITGYTSYTVFRYKSFNLKQNIYAPLLLIGTALCAFMCLMVIVFYLGQGQVEGKQSAADMFSFIVYLIMLAALILIYISQKKMLKHFYEEESRRLATIQPLYSKSGLNAGQIEKYALHIQQQMEEKRFFLLSDLSLVKLAKLLNIPPHYITQVLNTHLQTNFHLYVNTFRVQAACEMLLQKESLKLEVIAMESGFNSKVSFNRNFKSIMGCSPSDYRLRITNGGQVQ